MKTEDQYFKFVLWNEDDSLYIGYCLDLSFPGEGCAMATSKRRRITNCARSFGRCRATPQRWEGVACSWHAGHEGSRAVVNLLTRQSLK